MNSTVKTERINTVVVGGGQAGLAAGYHLSRRGVPCVILEANQRIGDSWRNRWDSLRLFTPARYDGLPGMPFPAHGRSFPTKDAMADYLEAYANRFALPVRTGVRVDRLWRNGQGLVVSAGDTQIVADHVVVAMADFQRHRVPAFAELLSADIRQLHSGAYRNPAQLKDGPVLLVGAGNSASEIAMELARSRPVLLAGTEIGHVPFRIETRVASVLLLRLVRFVGHRVLTLGTPVGRKLRPKMLHHGDPWIRVKPKDVLAAGVQRVGRVTAVRDGLPVTDDGRTVAVANVIWCTGFHPGFSWIDLPVFDEQGDPMHERGVVSVEPGLYFLGLRFLSAMTSSTIMGAGRDARHVVEAIAAGHGASAHRRLSAAA